MTPILSVVFTAVLFSFGLPAQSAQEAGPQARIAGAVMAGQIVTKVNPIYPKEAKAKHISGAVVLHAIISKDGSIERLNVMSGPEELRSASLDAVSRWVYKPYLLNGEPTEVDTTITVNYNFRPPPESADDPEEYAVAHPPSLLTEDSKLPTVHRLPDDIKGTIIFKVAPRYPAEAKAKHISGTVILHAIIDKDGDIARLTVVSGPETLRAASIEAVQQWRYQPYVVDGVPVAVDTDITVHFNFGR